MSIYNQTGKCNKGGKRCYACPVLKCFLVKDHKGECVLSNAEV